MELKRDDARPEMLSGRREAPAAVPAASLVGVRMPHVVAGTWLTLVMAEVGRVYAVHAPMTASFCAVYIAILCSIFALVERFRWGRLAMLALAYSHLILVGCASVIACAVAGASAGLRAIDPGHAGPGMVTLMLMNDLLTLVALKAPVVHREFVRGKRSRTARLQVFLAAAVVAWPVMALGAAVVQGAQSAVSVEGQFIASAAARQAAATRSR